MLETDNKKTLSFVWFHRIVFNEGFFPASVTQAATLGTTELSTGCCLFAVTQKPTSPRILILKICILMIENKAGKFIKGQDCFSILCELIIFI